MYLRNRLANAYVIKNGLMKCIGVNVIFSNSSARNKETCIYYFDSTLLRSVILRKMAYDKKDILAFSILQINLRIIYGLTMIYLFSTNQAKYFKLKIMHGYHYDYYAYQDFLSTMIAHIGIVFCGIVDFISICFGQRSFVYNCCSLFLSLVVVAFDPFGQLIATMGICFISIVNLFIIMVVDKS